MKFKILSLSIASLLLFTGCGEIAKGTKIGQVVKINESSGLFFKTVEIEMIRGGFNSGSGAQGSSLHFTVENDYDLSKLSLLKKAMIDGSEIEVDYHTEIVSFFRSDSNNNFGDKIKLVEKTKNEITSNNNYSYPKSNNEFLDLDKATKQELLKALKLQTEIIEKILKN